jgi:hypothetical protein
MRCILFRMSKVKTVKQYSSVLALIVLTIFLSFLPCYIFKIHFYFNSENGYWTFLTSLLCHWHIFNNPKERSYWMLGKFADRFACQKWLSVRVCRIMRLPVTICSVNIADVVILNMITEMIFRIKLLHRRAKPFYLIFSS